MSRKVSPGWYDHDNVLRYWDGETWTDNYRPKPEAKIGPSGATIALAVLVVLVGVAAIAIAATVPHSPSDVALSGGRYIRGAYWAGFLAGGIGSLALGILVGIVSTVNPRTATASALSSFALGVGLLTLGATGYVLIAYYGEADEASMPTYVE